MPDRVRGGLVALLLAAALGCGDGSTTPSGGVIVTFGVVDETFRVRLTDAGEIAAARRAQAGGPANIPNGRIVAGTDVNVGWRDRKSVV